MLFKCFVFAVEGGGVGCHGSCPVKTGICGQGLVLTGQTSTQSCNHSDPGGEALNHKSHRLHVSAGNVNAIIYCEMITVC